MRLSWSTRIQWFAAIALTIGMLAFLFQKARLPPHSTHNEVIGTIHDAEKANANLIKQSLSLTYDDSENYAILDIEARELRAHTDALLHRMAQSLGGVEKNLQEEILSLQKAVKLQLEEIEGFKNNNSLRIQSMINREEEWDANYINLVNKNLEKIRSSEVSSILENAQSDYERAFLVDVEATSLYRMVLYAWSLIFLVALIITLYRYRQLSLLQEQKVIQRTAELDDALSSLWGEMELATRIQTALVPAKPLLHGCDVAASMYPAEIVGGDYYDVLNVGDYDWVLIGDVSGHGVPAGLIMMMCQTAVQTELQAHPDLDPDVLLARVNSTLVENMRRLGEQKYMTLSALRRDPDGTYHFAGLHQDLFIRRAESNTVEEIQSTGTWLGLMHNIDENLPVGQFRLDSGDVLLLYTDGITEAQKDGVMLGNEGLVSLLQESTGRTAEDILEGILESVSSFAVDDDVSVIVIRHV